MGDCLLPNVTFFLFDGIFESVPVASLIRITFNEPLKQSPFLSHNHKF